MIRSIAAACLLALLVNLGAVMPARADDPITTNMIFGFVTSPIPDALKYPYVPPLTDHTGGATTLYGSIRYRQKAPAANKSALVTLTAQSYGINNEKINEGSLSYSYDANANTTTIKIQNSTDTVQMVVPINLQQVFSDQDPKIQAGTLKENGSISGSVGSATYVGTVVKYTSPNQGESFLAYQMRDGAGKVILYARVNNGGVPDIRIPGATGFGTTSAAYGVPPSGSTLPPNCGSGTFSQTVNGQTLSGTFQPISFSVYSFDASQDAYWSMH